MSAATRVFIESGGFRRTQIGDVAKAMGVAKGTLYLYVESKEALFDLVMRHADQPEQGDPELPVRTPPEGATLAYLAERMSAQARFSALARAEGRAERRAGPATTMAEELGGIVDEIYDVLAHNRTAIKLIGTSAHDLPELADLWYARARGTLNTRLAKYVSRRSSEGLLFALPDPIATARFVTETASWFAVHRFWDPHPDPIDDDAAKATAREAILRALLPTMTSEAHA